MKKRLLFAFMALCTAVSGFALSEGEYVYTPQGRFQITGANVASSNFADDLKGWTVVSASAEKTLADNFNVNANGYAEGFNSVASLDATAGEGMYFKFEPSDAGATYVVSYKMKGAVATSVRINLTAQSGEKTPKTVDLTNVVRIQGNSANVFGDATDELIANTGEELSEEWQTFNYAIVGDGTSRTYYISFTGMATNIEIADLQIAPAEQYADLRQRDAMLEKLNAYKTCYDWKAEEAGDLDDAIALFSEIGDESSQEELEDKLTTANEILATFLTSNMDDYLAGNTANYFGIKQTSGNTQKASSLGDWTCFPSGRGFWSSGAYPDMGHFQQGNKWCNGSPDAPMGASMQKTLTTGSYVFAIEANAAVREPAKQGWTLDEGTKPAYGVAYIVKVNGEQVDTIASVVKDLQPIQYTPFIVPAKITEDGTYEFGFKAYCKETHRDLTNGSVVYVKDASIWGKNQNIYNQKQLSYEADVREQITTGRNALTTATEYLSNADYLWGKADLQACVDTVEAKIAAYELWDQDQIIATYEDYYVKSTSDAENGLMVYEVYQAGVKDILDANRTFTAVNDTLNSIQVAIDAAEATMALRIYGTATGKADLQTAIDVAKGVQAKMKAAQYSEENAATITAANADLAAAVETFKGTIPAANIATIVDIDFEADAIQNAETQSWEVTGAAGTMVFSRFSTDNDTEPGGFKKGFWSNGEAQWKGYLRVGNGTGTVNFDPTENGSMGTNILKINCDFFLQGLSNRYIGFFMKDEAGENIAAAFYASYYNNAIDAQSNLNIELGSLQYGSGGQYDNGSPEGAEPATANPLAKNSFEVILDYGEGTMYCTTTSKKGVVTTAKQEFTGVIPRSFILQSNYDDKFSSRYCWFDNLKIQRITAGVPTGIENVKTVAKAQDNVMYNLAGQKVNKSFKGIAIMNGKKIVVK